MKKEDVKIGESYFFVKSGNVVTVLEKSSTGHNHFVAERVNTKKSLIVTSDGLEEIIENND